MQFIHPFADRRHRKCNSGAENAPVRRIDRPPMVRQEFLRHELDYSDGENQIDPVFAEAAHAPSRYPVKKQIADVCGNAPKGDDGK
ncbi:MAG: hypothetical protein AB7V14_07495 [Kiritimatiellia bacterium]